MTTQAIFLFQIGASLLVMGLLAQWKVSPWLVRQSHKDGLFWLTVPHAFRYVGLVFLVPSVTAEPLPDYFAVGAAYGDLAAAGLALIALTLLKYDAKVALWSVWLFNIVGTVDLISALGHVEVVPLFGAAWFIPTLLVPLLLVTHFMIFVRLIKPTPKTEY